MSHSIATCTTESRRAPRGSASLSEPLCEPPHGCLAEMRSQYAPFACFLFAMCLLPSSRSQPTSLWEDLSPALHVVPAARPMELLLRLTPVLAAFAMVIAARTHSRRVRGTVAVLGALAMLLPAALGLTFRAAGTEYLTLGSGSGFAFLGSVIAIAAIGLALRNGASRRTALLLVPPTILYLWWLICPRMLGGSVDAAILTPDALGRGGIAALAIPHRCVLIWRQIEPRAIPIVLAVGSTAFAAAAFLLPISALTTMRTYLRGSKVFLHALGVSRFLMTLLVAITAGSLLQGIDEQLRSAGMHPGSRVWSAAQETAFYALAKALGCFALGLIALVHGLADITLSGTRVLPRISFYLRRDPVPSLYRTTVQDERVLVHRFDAAAQTWMPEPRLVRTMRDGLCTDPNLRYISEADAQRARATSDLAIAELWPDPSSEQSLAAESLPGVRAPAKSWRQIAVRAARAAALTLVCFIVIFALIALGVRVVG